jgi:beta-lactamase regulating signal transducer with metallopeptidase domain
MSIGMSLFLIAVGAILKYAVTDSISGVDLQTVGVILMVVGAIGLLISIIYLVMSRERTVTHRRDPHDRDPLR